MKELLARDGANIDYPNVFMTAASFGNVAIVVELLVPHWKIPVASKTRHGDTALSLAAENGHVLW